MGFGKRGIVSSKLIGKLKSVNTNVTTNINNELSDKLFNSNDDFESQFILNGSEDSSDYSVSTYESQKSDLNISNEQASVKDVDGIDNSDSSIEIDNNKVSDDKIEGSTVDDNKLESSAGNKQNDTNIVEDASSESSDFNNSSLSSSTSSDNLGTDLTSFDSGLNNGTDKSSGSKFGMTDSSFSSESSSSSNGTTSDKSKMSSGINTKRSNEKTAMIEYTDVNGDKQEISLADYRQSLENYGLFDEDIDRLFYEGVVFEDLLHEILNDEDDSRRRHIYDSQFFNQVKAEYESVDINNVDIIAENIASLEDEKAELQSKLTDLINNTGRDTYQGKVYSAEEAKAIQDVKDAIADLENQIKDLETESNQIELGNNYKDLLSDINSIDDLDDTIESMQEELDDLLAQRSLLQNKLDSLKTVDVGIGMQYDVNSFYEVNNYRDELGDFNSKYGNRIDELTKSLSELNAIKKSIENETYERVELLDPYEAKSDFAENDSFLGTNNNILSDLYEKYESYSDGTHRDFSITLSSEDEAELLSYVINGKVEYNDNNFGLFSAHSSDGLIEHYSKWLSEGGNEQIITDEEIAVFNYIYNVEGKEASLEYLKKLEEILDQRYLILKTAHDQAYASEHPVLASLGSILVTPLEGMNAIAASFHAKSTDDKLLRTDVYSSGDVWRAQVSQDVLENGGEGAAFLYNTVMSMADSGELIAITALTGGSGAAVFSAALMGSRAYVSSLNDALDRGLDDDQAIMLAASSAIVETAMESYSLGHLMNLEEHLGEGTMQLVRNTLLKTDDEFTVQMVYCLAGAVSQGFAEGEEEFATEILNHCFDELISGDLSNMSLTIQSYISQGYSEQEAKEMAMLDFGDQLYQSFLGGFVSGLCFGSFGSIRTTHAISNGIAKEIRQNYGVSSATSFVAGLEVNDAVQEAVKSDQISEVQASDGQTNLSSSQNFDSEQTTRLDVDSQQAKQISEETFSKYAQNGIGEFTVSDLVRSFSSESLFQGTLVLEANSRGLDFLEPFHEFYESVVASNLDIDNYIIDKLNVLNDLYQNRVDNLGKMETIFQATMSRLNIDESSMIKQINGYLNSGNEALITSREGARELIKSMSHEEIEIALRDYLQAKALKRAENLRMMELTFDTMMKKYNLDTQAVIENVLNYLKTGNVKRITQDNGVRNYITNLSMSDLSIALDDYINKHVTINSTDAVSIFDSIYNAAIEENKVFDAKKLYQDFVDVVINKNVYNGLLPQILSSFGMQNNEAFTFSQDASAYLNGQILLKKFVSNYTLDEEKQLFMKKLIEIKRVHPEFSIVVPTKLLGAYHTCGSVFIGSRNIAWNDIGTMMHEVGHAVHYYEMGLAEPSEWNSIVSQIKLRRDFSVMMENASDSLNYTYDKLRIRAISEIVQDYTGIYSDDYDSIFSSQPFLLEVDNRFQSMKSCGDLKSYLILNGVSEGEADSFIKEYRRSKGFLSKLIGSNEDAILQNIARIVTKMNIDKIIAIRAENYQRNSTFDSVAFCDILSALVDGTQSEETIVNGKKTTIQYHILPDGRKINLQYSHNYNGYYDAHPDYKFAEIYANFTQLKVSGFQHDLMELKRIIGDYAYSYLDSYYYSLMTNTQNQLSVGQNMVRISENSMSTVAVQNSIPHGLILKEHIDIDFNDYIALKEVMNSINNLSDFNGFDSLNDYKKAFAQELISSGKLEKITNGQCVFELVSDSVILKELVGTEKFNNLIIKNILNPVFSDKLSHVLGNLSVYDFNELFESTNMSDFILNLSDDDFSFFVIKLVDNSHNALQNDVIVDRLLKLDNDKLLDLFTKLNTRNSTDYYNNFYNSISEDSSYIRLLKEVQQRFINPDYYFDNISLISKLDNRLCSFSTYRIDNKYVANVINDFSSSINALKDEALIKISDVSNGILVNDYGLHFNDDILDGSKYYVLSYVINGKTFYKNITNYGGKLLFNPDNIMLSAAYRGELSNISLASDTFKNNLEITSSMGLIKGLNEVTILVDGVEQTIVINTVWDSYNIESWFSRDSIVEIKDVKPIPDFNMDGLEVNKLYEVILDTDKGEVVRYIKTNPSGKLNVNDVISSDNISGVINVTVNEISLRDCYHKLTKLDSFAAFSDVFSERAFGGNQSDVYNLLNNKILGLELSNIEIKKAQLLDSLINKYFDNISDVDKIKLAEHYANGGCFYMALANIFATYMGSLDNGISIFKNLFGYDLFYSDEKSAYYNLEAIAFEIYLNYFSKNYTSVDEIINSGSAGISIINFDDIIRPLFEEKGIRIEKDQTLRFGVEPNVSSLSNTLMEDLLSKPNSFHILSANDFSMELLSTSQIGDIHDLALSDANSLKHLYEHVGGHAMTIVDIDSEGNLIVSSWGGKFKIPLSAVIENSRNNERASCRITNISFNIIENVIQLAKGGE